ncbi:MAG: hypothetical protein AAF740_08580, partial [Bacteroidota bacterium]
PNQVIPLIGVVSPNYSIMLSWSYLENPFDNRTKGNYKRMLEMATDHFDKLKERGRTDTQIQGLYDFGNPAYDAFVKAYRESGYIRSVYREQTATLEGMMAELASSLARRWDSMIVIEYDKPSPQYQSLMPDGRMPLQRGSYEMRIEELNRLARRLGDFPSLATVATEVQKFADKVKEIRSAQQGKETLEQGNVNLLESARKTLAGVMQAICGQLTFYHWKEMEKVEDYYELKYLRWKSSKNVKSEGETEITESFLVPANEIINVFADQLEEGQTVRLTNTGAAILSWKLTAADEPTALPTGDFVNITIPESVTSISLQNETEAEGEVLAELI